MSIEIKTEEGTVFKFGTVEEFQAFVEAVKPEDAKAEVDMENLPIGTLVKVVGNRAGHWHEIGEILPITEVIEGAYKLDDRGVGWVAVEDIEFVSFTEEEESTSGDEGLTVDEEDTDKPAPKLEVGDTVKVLRNITEGFDEGTIGKVVEILPSGSLMIESDCGGPYIHSSSALELVEESEPEFKVGDKVQVKGADYLGLEGGDVGVICGVSEHIRHTHSGRLIPTPYEVSTNTDLVQWVAPEHLELIDEVESEDSEIKAGDTVIATEAEFDITEGVEYEIREDVDGDRYFLDDAGDLRFVLNHEGRLRKKIIEVIEEPKLEVGDILRCNKDSMYVTEGKLYEVLAIDRDGDAVYMDDGNSVSFVNETDIPERFEIL